MNYHNGISRRAFIAGSATLGAAVALHPFAVQAAAGRGPPAHHGNHRPARRGLPLRLLRRCPQRHARPVAHCRPDRGDPRRSRQLHPRRQWRRHPGQPHGRLHRLRKGPHQRAASDHRRHEHARLRSRHAGQPRVQLRPRVPRRRHRRRQLPDRLGQPGEGRAGRRTCSPTPPISRPTRSSKKS